MFTSTPSFIRLVLAGLWLLCSLQVAAADRSYVAHQLQGQALAIETTDGSVLLTPHNGAALEVHYRPAGMKQLPSYAIAGEPERVKVSVTDRGDWLEFEAAELRVRIEKSPLRLSYFSGERLLLEEEAGLFNYETVRGFRFKLKSGEKLMGGGQRVLGMDRRGHSLPLYNKAHYGYSTESEQMYYSVPAVLSSEQYMLVFDNSARGNLDLGNSDPDVLQFDAVAGRTSYLVVGGNDYEDILANYTALTGRQPMPPRWAFGNFASRFGYHSEAETRDVVQRFRDLDIPLDAVVLDIFWFGPDIQGHMGNLDWDRNAFPTPEKMIADFAADGVNTVLISEPFVLSTSDRWQEAVDKGVLAKNASGSPKRFDFYFGNSGIIDVFDEDAADWFWDIYRGLIDQGAHGVWGDLGEPELHPGDTLHAAGTADEIHNAYGHKWAELVYRNHVADYPERRPMILMRSGFAGSQRYGMIPWTGDVDRSWGGLQSQVELSLQMGLMGLGYIHSDLGGFAGGETFDPELYLRWLQFGVFQPIFRPHAQEHIPPEPVFHTRHVQDEARRLIKLRYRLLPYLYTLAWQNNVRGVPLARPLFFEASEGPDAIDYKDAYLWGYEFLVSPVVKPGVEQQSVKLPAGVWFDFWSGQRYQGGTEVEIPVTARDIPVLVRAGAFVPMVDDVATTRDYSTARMTVHYYDDPSVEASSGVVYDDDGHTRDAYARGQYELLQFQSRRENGQLSFSLRKRGGGFASAPQARDINLVVHNWTEADARVLLGEQGLAGVCSGTDDTSCAEFDPSTGQLSIRFRWDGEPLEMKLGESVATSGDVGKPVVYQMFPRLFGNTNTTNQPWGTIETNGVGKLNDIDARALAGIRELGVTHVWYTGVPHHALVRDYKAYGISDDDPDVVKGRAGSPYAVKDYYAVNPDLAVDPARRQEEFAALIERTHAAGMKVVIDLVPNHVARSYESIEKPPGVEDFGARDDTSVEYHRDNNFYYIVGEAFQVPDLSGATAPLGGEAHPLADGKFAEHPAKWTGNGSRAAQPRADDWYETVKVNYGVRPDGSYDFPRLPAGYANKSLAEHAQFWEGKDVPDSWLKVRHIALYWLEMGVDGLRYDMAEMVPVEFWSFLNSSIKAAYPDAFLLAEIYNRDAYRDYIHLGKMDYLYNKVELYDTVRDIVSGELDTDALEPIRAMLADIDPHMLTFLENHDEQRIASPEFAGDADKARPAMVVTATIGSGPTLLYHGQEVGEAGAEDAGFGRASRTTIFDYWGIPSLQRWVNGGSYDGGALTAPEQSLRRFYAALMQFTASSPALSGDYYDLHSYNRKLDGGYDARLFSYARWSAQEKLIVGVNFTTGAAGQQALQLPEELILAWGLEDGRYATRDAITGETGPMLEVRGGTGLILLDFQPLAYFLLQIRP